MQGTTQLIVTDRPSIDPNQKVESVAMFAADGTSVSPFGTYSATTGSAVGTVGKSSSDPEPQPNTLIAVIFTNGNTAASPTLAFDGGTARAMKLGGTASAAAKLAVASGGMALFWFDGTVLHQIGAYT
jgi:hypothetical protein